MIQSEKEKEKNLFSRSSFLIYIEVMNSPSPRKKQQTHPQTKQFDKSMVKYWLTYIIHIYTYKIWQQVTDYASASGGASLVWRVAASPLLPVVFILPAENTVLSREQCSRTTLSQKKLHSVVHPPPGCCGLLFSSSPLYCVLMQSTLINKPLAASGCA